MQESEAFMVVIMEYCDLGSLLRAISKKAFRPHGKWSYATTYVSSQLVTELAAATQLFAVCHFPSLQKPCNAHCKSHRIARNPRNSLSDIPDTTQQAFEAVADDTCTCAACVLADSTRGGQGHGVHPFV